jgi:hypothetical protein
VTPKETVSTSPPTRFSRLVVGCAGNVPTSWYGCKRYLRNIFLASWSALFPRVPVAFVLAEKQHIPEPFRSNQLSIDVSADGVLGKPEVLSRLSRREKCFVV